MVSPEIMRDTDLMLKSKQSGVEKPVKLTKKKTATILRRNTFQLEDRDRKCVIANNNILLLSRSDMEQSNKTFNMATVVNTVKRSVILPQADKVKGKEAESPMRIPRVSESGLTVRKLCVRPVRLESKEVRPGPVLLNRVQTCSVNLGRKSEPPQEPINLSLKPQDKEQKIFLKVVDENKLKYSQDKTEETTSVKSDPVYSVSSKSPELSIIPVINLTDNSGQDSQPIQRDEDTNDSREDIDDDEESFLQKMGEEIGDMVQVKLECEEGESKKQTKLSYSCPKCSRSYSKKSLCELHMKKVHFSLRSKEKCNICGVRFINLQAHKEKYHYFVDVDKCHLCGKVVKYLSSHHCPLQKDLRLKEVKLECPKCGNLVKQKYLKIHQKNHCVGISSTFSNFRTANQDLNDSPRMPLHLISKPVPTSETKEEARNWTAAAIKRRKEIHLTPR